MVVTLLLRALPVFISAFAAGLFACVISAQAQNAGASLVAPPRSIADISANLEREKPDPAARAKILADADANVSGTGASGAEQLMNRARARAAVGRGKDAVVDAEAAIKMANAANVDYGEVVSRYEVVLVRLLRATGDPKRAVSILENQIKALQNNYKGRLFSLNHQLVIALLNLGDINRAEVYARNNRTLLTQSREWKRPDLDPVRTYWASDVEDSNARVFDARGRYADAEQSYRRARDLMADAQRQSVRWPTRPARDTFGSASDWMLAFEGRAKARQGRVTEGEADVRRALIGRLTAAGKYHGDTAGILAILCWVLGEQGRQQEAEKIAIEIEGIYRQLGQPDDSRAIVNTRLLLASTLNMQRCFEDAAEVYRSVDRATVNWPPAQREAAVNSASRVNALLSSNNTTDADSVDMSA